MGMTEGAAPAAAKGGASAKVCEARRDNAAALERRRLTSLPSGSGSELHL